MPVPAFFALTLASSAALLFVIQPLAARAALPILGGSPAVWNTSMVFFQTVVLAGYAAAHFVARRLPPPAQAAAFLTAILASAAVLPPTPPADIAPPSHPLAWLLSRLASQLALPCFALALASPLLQRWFASITRDQREPYSLYAASNAGSLAALLAYPILIEPTLDLSRQASLWSLAFAAWGLAILAASIAFLRAPHPHPQTPTPAPAPAPDHPPANTSPAPTPRPALAWVALGAIPASLLQGCTLFLTTDVASVPLLWVVPLALYLASFIIAFARHGSPAVHAANRALPFLAAALLFVILSRATQPVGLLVALHLAFLLLAGLACHGRLVASRPPPEHLTSFYLALALGGVLGGAFNALAAPHLFRSVAEYPLAIALACAVLPPRSRASAPAAPPPPAPILWARDLAWAASIAAAMAVLGFLTPWWTPNLPRLRDALVFGLPAVACCALLDRPRRLALALAAAFLTGLTLQSAWTHTQHSERNFFGITRVTADITAGSHQIVHGNTIHGRQFQDPARRREPLTYYHRLGPLGSAFDALRHLRATHQTNPPPRIGVIGLGAGSMAAYALPDESWAFFEIDPAVIRVARDPRWFSFLHDASATRIEIIQGDARLRLREQPDTSFDLLVLDAFSSDAIPVHLLTREALALYLRKLRPGGWLLVHISNRYLNLEPVVATLARDANLACRTFDDTHEDPALGKEPSHWMLLARATADFGPLNRRIGWLPVSDPGSRQPWTDRRAGVLEAFTWR